MKNWNQIIKVLLLVSIYCFGVCISTKALPYSSAHPIEQNNKQHKYVTSASKILFFHTEQSEDSLSSLSEYSLQNFKLSYTDFWVTSLSIEILCKATFKQYKNHLKTILIRYRKSDLIFPFHNFW
jgi:hypothetical protein